MLVLAFDTKEKVEKKSAWLGPNNKYYTSEEAYIKWKKKKANAKYYKNKKRKEKKEAKKAREKAEKNLKINKHTYVLALDINELITKDKAWLAPNKRYYTSEEGYKKWLKSNYSANYYRKKKREEKMTGTKKNKAVKKLNEAESQAYKKCVDLMFEWMGYPGSAKMPRLFYGQMGQWHNVHNYSYEVVLETMLYVQESLFKAFATKDFKDDSSMVKYICVTIGNHLNDGLKSFARKQKEIHEAQEEAEHIPYDIPTEEELMNLGNREKQLEKDHTEMREIMKRIMGDLW